MERARGDVIYIRLYNVVRLDLLQNFGIHAHLLVCSVVVAAGVDAEDAEFSQNNAKKKGGTYGDCKNKYRTLN